MELGSIEVYVPPMLVEAGAFAEVTWGIRTIGKFRVGRYYWH
ncbi:lasso RiPP family leader peptide-containing protein [Streptomyces sp. NPDC003077]